jgi:hypothetical protein
MVVERREERHRPVPIDHPGGHSSFHWLGARFGLGGLSRCGIATGGTHGVIRLDSPRVRAPTSSDNGADSGRTVPRVPRQPLLARRSVAVWRLTTACKARPKKDPRREKRWVLRPADARARWLFPGASSGRPLVRQRSVLREAQPDTEAPHRTALSGAARRDVRSATATRRRPAHSPGRRIRRAQNQICLAYLATSRPARRLPSGRLRSAILQVGLVAGDGREGVATAPLGTVGEPLERRRQGSRRPKKARRAFKFRSSSAARSGLLGIAQALMLKYRPAAPKQWGHDSSATHFLGRFFAVFHTPV